MPEDDHSKEGVAIQDYWAALTAMGLRRPTRITDQNFIMTTRDGDCTTIPDPGRLTPVERSSALELIKSRVG